MCFMYDPTFSISQISYIVHPQSLTTVTEPENDEFSGSESPRFQVASIFRWTIQGVCV